MELTLYAIEEELQTWIDTLDLAQTEEDRAVIAQNVHDYLELAKDKRDRFCQFLAHLEHTAFALKVEEDKLSHRRRRMMALQETLEQYAVNTIEALGLKKLEGEIHEMRLVKNPDSVVIIDESQVPEEYKEQKPAPPPQIRKDWIKDAIKSGKEVPGADLQFGRNRLKRL